MTAPLTPPECDVRALPYLPFEVGRLLDSDFYALSTGEQFKAGLALWCKAWTQVPAASMPTDERLLAKAVGLTLDAWREVAPMALRGWVECGDGRLYHPVVAEKALRGWIERIQMKERSAKGNATRYDSFNYKPEAFAALKADAVRYLVRLAPSAEAEFGVVLQGDKLPPVRRAASSPKESLKEPKTSQLNGTERNGTEGNGTEAKSLVVSPVANPTTDTRQAFDLFNRLAAEVGIPTARALTDDRAKKLTAYLKEEGLSGWESVLDAVRNSPHCLGHNDRRWKADLDFLLTPSRRTRLLEGSYSHTGPTGGGGGGQARSYLDAALELAH